MGAATIASSHNTNTCEQDRFSYGGSCSLFIGSVLRRFSRKFGMQDKTLRFRSLRKGALLYALVFVTLVNNTIYAQPNAPARSGANQNASVSVVPPTQHPVQRGWKKTFNEDFNGTKLGKCWKTSYVDNVHTLAANGEQEWYVDPDNSAGYSPFRVSHGVLSIQAIAAASLPRVDAHGLPYLSGMIMSDGCFAQTYGYFEIKTKVPAGKGLWPAFWLLPTSHQWPPEADVFEMFGAPNSRHEGGLGWVHTGTVGGGIPAYNDWHKVGIDQYAEFHTYGLLWGPEIMSLYIDNRFITSQQTPKNLHQPMYLIANLAIGGRWPESPDPSTHFPASMEIDSIQAWQYAPWQQINK